MSVIKADPHPVVATDPSGNTIDVVTSAATTGKTGLVVYVVPSSAVSPVQGASEGPTNTTAPADATLVGGTDGSNNLQALQVDANKQLKVSNIGVALNSYGQVSVGVTATSIKGATAGRAALLVTNAGSTTVFLGDASVTILTGFPLAAGSTVGVPQTSALFGIVAASTATVGFMEFV